VARAAKCSDGFISSFYNLDALEIQNIYSRCENISVQVCSDEKQQRRVTEIEDVSSFV